MIVLILFCLGLATFCVFGFAATFEPLEQATQTAWRIAYGAGVLASLAVAAWMLNKRRASRKPESPER